MSPSTTGVDRERDRSDGPDNRANTTPSVWMRPSAPDRQVLVVSSIALGSIAVSTVARVLYNVPSDPVEFPSQALASVEVLATVLLALALVTLALVTDRIGVRVGLLFAGVFGVMATVSEAATVPAVVAITGGCALALARQVRGRGPGHRLLASAFPVAVGIALATTTGVLDAGLRGAGTVVFLAGVTLLVLRTDGGPAPLIAGAVGFAAVVAISAAVPFTTGSALLVAFGVVGGPHLLVATAVFGGVAAAVSGLLQGRYGLTIGAALLLLSGVPATPVAAMAVCLGATLACTDLDALVGPPGSDAAATGASAS